MAPSGFAVSLVLNCNRSTSFGAISRPTASPKAGQNLPRNRADRVVAIRRDALVLREHSVMY